MARAGRTASSKENFIMIDDYYMWFGLCYRCEKVKLIREVDEERDRWIGICMYLYLNDGCRHVDIRVRSRNAKNLIDVVSRKPRSVVRQPESCLHR
jgi:hypothetical protein